MSVVKKKKFNIREDGSVNFRINNLTTNSKYFIEAFEKEKDGKIIKSYFGDFTIRDENLDDTLDTFEKLVDVMQVPDTIFGGQYPVLVNDGQYGHKIKVMGRPKFYESLNGRQIVGEEIFDYIYDVEVAVTVRKDEQGLYVAIPRAFKSGVRNNTYTDDELFGDHEISGEDDLPF